MTAKRFLPVGKLPLALLNEQIGRIRRADDRVVLGPRIGEDAALIDFGDRFLVAKTDPITFATDRIGWYAVHITANDVAVMGAQPRWFLAALLLPEGRTDADLVAAIFADIAAAGEQLGVTLIGGHTEITAGLDRPIIVGQMLAEVEKARAVSKDQARVGDWILLTKGVAIEGTAVLARERDASLAQRVDASILERAKAYLVNPGISVVADALTACSVARVHAMHDPTEGGILGGLWELAAAASLGMHVVAERIPVLPETRILCQALGLDPLRLIASGALLIVAPPAECDRIIAALSERGTPVSIIGEMKDPAYGTKIETNGHIEPFDPPERDEIARLFDSEQPRDPRASEARGMSADRDDLKQM